MATVITFANQKGGAGKSTITALLANSLSQDYNKRVLVIDCDLQASLTHMRQLQIAHDPDAKFSYDMQQVSLKDLQKTCEVLQKKYDIILVDIPGVLYSPDGDTGKIIKFMFICDIVLIPIRPGIFDYDSSVLFYKHLIEVQTMKRKMTFDMEVFGFINQYTNTASARELDELTASSQFPMLKSKISQLADYQRAASSTKSLNKQPVSNPRIKREFTEFTDEVMEILNQF